jgi:uncharacterized protein (DUF1800 family)
MPGETIERARQTPPRFLEAPSMRLKMHPNHANTFAFVRYVAWVVAAIVAWALIVTQVKAQMNDASPAKSNAPTVAPKSRSGAIGFDDARHLLGRTSFAAQPNEIETYATLTRADAVDRLLSSTKRQASYPAPEWTKTYERAYRPEMTQEERQKVQRREQVERGLELRTWWTAEMLTTPSPLTEKMTLFWHNHFATSQQKVRVAQLMYRQNVLFRQYALGNFGGLLREVSKDPAMLIYLDGAQNRKGMPNENFAREVMELFTLGEGNYSEQDIKEVARAFSGWSMDIDAGDFRFRRPQHDDGEKTIFGQRGRFNGDDVVTLLLKHEKTAEFIVGKLWLEFVSPTPNKEEVKRIAKVFRDGGYELKPALRAMLLSEDFWEPTNRAVLVKSPVELVIGSLRQFRFEVEDPAPFSVVMRQLGQDLFGPPNVKGWPGGETWLNTTTLLARKSFLNRLFRTDEMGTPELNDTATALIDRDMMGERRQRAQARLALAGGGSGMASEGMMSAGKAGAMVPFGVNNQMKGQYHFDATKWFAQYPNQSDGEMLWKTLLAGPPVQATELKYNLAGLRAVALDPMYQLK